MTVIAQARLSLEDPHDCTDGSDTLTVFHALYDTLVRRVGQDFVPYLAQRWAVSDDARTWTFHLHPGVMFHDGTPCDASAVAASLARMAREDKGYTLGAPAVWRQYLGAAGITVPDDLTVILTLRESMADLLDVLEQGFIVAPSAFAALDAGDHSRQIGSGPYRLESMTSDRLTARRVHGHFAGTPANPFLTWERVPDPADRLALLEQGKVQVANGFDFLASQRLGAMRHVYLSPVAIIYLLNAARGPLADARMRRALSLAVDRDALIADVVAGAAPDRHTALRLLAEAGHADGLTLDVDCPTRLPDEAERLTAVLADQLAQVGVTLSVFVHSEREDYAHMVRRKEIRDMCVFDSSPMSTYRVLYEKIDSRVAGAWWQGYANPAIEALLDQGRATTDRIRRAAIWRKACRLLQDDPAWLTLYNPLRVIGLAGAHPAFQMPADGVIDAARLPLLPEV
ncbi:MAG: peptide ABC transporter substrate-binding protein [Alphaproteobacteria bacterium HGW-Alphaproteobacteria-1]|jgi:ABC-type transport system substrate-binding protein|nr:MAG: peptide ABC transporter substrate-binding protein [Alphaproteobacteria bacterium HGW-Alphaproteobacteria-1]